MGVNKGYDYTRSGNPTRSMLESTLAHLEGGIDCICTATGMAATGAILHLLRPGDHVITGDDIYGGSYRMMHSVFSNYGIEFEFIDMTDSERVAAAIRDTTRLIYIETPSNPLLRLVDIEAVATLGHQAGAMVAVDNTFSSPVFQRPLDLGADLVIHSTTKYINGHSDVVGGAVISNSAELAEKLRYTSNACGLSQSPWDAWLVLRGVRTLAPRMQVHNSNALAIAEFLQSHPAVSRVYYPGLPDHPQHALAKRQMKGYGGVVSFDFRTPMDTERLDSFFGKLRYFALAESLGGVESLIESPFFMSHASMPEEARRGAGISEGTVRVSAGIEHSRDLIDDLSNALDAVTT